MLVWGFFCKLFCINNWKHVLLCRDQVKMKNIQFICLEKLLVCFCNMLWIIIHRHWGALPDQFCNQYFAACYIICVFKFIRVPLDCRCSQCYLTYLTESVPEVHSCFFFCLCFSSTLNTLHDHSPTGILCSPYWEHQWRASICYFNAQSKLRDFLLDLSLDRAWNCLSIV